MTPATNIFCFVRKFNRPYHGDAVGVFHPYMEACDRLYSKGGTVAPLKFDDPPPRKANSKL